MGQYKSMQGKTVDIEKLAKQHELTPAVSNIKINARGDLLGDGGKIVQRREDVVSSYYESAPKVKATNIPTEFVEEKVEPIVDVKPAAVAPEIVKPTKKET
jgi:hypothetical protein